MKLIAQISMERCPEGLELGDKESEKVLKRIEKVKLEYIIYYLDNVKSIITKQDITSRCLNGLLRK